MSFTNLYYKRTTGTPKACWICYKPTTTVLATINTVDFLYACDSHLTDRGFASPISESSDGVNGAQKLNLGPEEIAKVKEEWEEKQKLKAEKEKGKTTEDGSDNKDDEKQKKEGVPSPKPPGALPHPIPQKPSASHQRFTLHRDIFTMRLTEHRKRRQATQAKELAPRLPGAPRGDVA
ncbi:DUF1742-domain-containing protein [Lentinula aciculospora]|uniref:DUF1742-domain-containing protein n=1 Tax=Lentinula aciculospora TaxID=153920 RepID=A0A9W9A197_9AGAR|nr:DUF1742-domain-containing protein [Lentinula aciculospora]